MFMGLSSCSVLDGRFGRKWQNFAASSRDHVIKQSILKGDEILK